MRKAKACAESKEFTVGHESITFTCERKGRHEYHRASWGLFAQVEWVSVDTLSADLDPRPEPRRP